ncbi:flagellar protein FliS [Sphingobium xanthum]|jgi:flagellar protein FliS|uniref:flagellar export chaperone FliS n=1 Tax=Sphingobium xanthum TaxID=1387165 RepID=UPI001C8B22D2|nr:flagellar export chaperone FliS [Sphingobium xanthum]
MYMGQQSIKAAKRYAAIDTGSRVEGATPHQLVRILYDELLLCLDTALVALKTGDRHKWLDRQTRALTILHALETSLDFDRGGDVATSLATVYREVRRRMLTATTVSDPAPMEAARGFIADIAAAWTEIG